jgi:Xaa-Pro aminopeptidase
MKANLDALMLKRGLDALIVVCQDLYSATRDYLTGGVSISGGYILKKRGEAPFLVVNPMEIEEAKKSGLTCYTWYDLGWAELLEQYEGNRQKIMVPFWGNLLAKADVTSGKVGVYGAVDFGSVYEAVRGASAAYPQITFVGDSGNPTLFAEAMQTKDADELARMQDIAARTNQVIAATWDYIGGHRAAGDTVVKQDGTPLTIGDVKRFVRRELLDRELECSEMIFAQGRDGGFPHSCGEADDALKLGQAIIFDLFPNELGGGYHHDSTRTWCIGHASEAVQEAYDQVMTAFDIAVEVIRPGMETKVPQEAVQRYFETYGHDTTRSNPKATEGYTHSLGHGLGLNIHESPALSHLSKDTFAIGNLLTIEPGLYYPDRGFGVRIEDTFYLSESGELISLTPFHKDLVLPLRG